MICIWILWQIWVNEYLTTPPAQILHWLLEREREMFYLTTHSTHFIYGYMASDIWLRIIMGYSFRLTARVLLYAPSHRQDSTYHSLCYTSRGALAGTRNMATGCQTKCIGSITMWHCEIMYNVECYPNEVDQFVVNVRTLGQEETAARTEFVKEKQLLFLGNK